MLIVAQPCDFSKKKTAEFYTLKRVNFMVYELDLNIKKVEVIKSIVTWRAPVSSEEQPYSAAANCSGRKVVPMLKSFQFLKRSQKSRIWINVYFLKVRKQFRNFTFLAACIILGH